MSNKTTLNLLFELTEIRGKFSILRPIDVKDAKLILDLRTRRQNNFLKATHGGIEEQISYLNSYINRFNNREEIYYKIHDPRTKTDAGVVRLTELNSSTAFNWQSLVVSEAASPQLALDAMMLIYSIGFDWLGRSVCGPWEVKKTFEKMMKIHAFTGMAEVVSSDDEYFHVAVTKERFFNQIGRFRKLGLGHLESL